MNPKISFLIATKNRGDIIEDTLGSLLLQTEPDWEAIIVDDHGDDDTEEIIKEYNDHRFRYYRLTDAHGLGVNCARNFAAMQAETEIVAILDSDDICYANRVDVTLETFKQNPNSDVFYGHIDIWDENTGEIRERKTPFTEFSLENFKEKNFIPHPTVAIRKKVLIDNPYNPFFRLVEDYELLTRLAMLGKRFVWSSEKILKYRISTTNSSIGEDKKELLKCYSDLIHMLRGWQKYDKMVLERINVLESRR